MISFFVKAHLPRGNFPFQGNKLGNFCSSSHFREDKFRHNFQDTINPLCCCSLKKESTSHFFLRCRNFITPRTKLHNLDSNILNLDEIFLTKLLLYGASKYENKVNKNILLASINFVLSTKRFEGQLM